jgi:glycosyl transferase, family 25
MRRIIDRFDRCYVINLRDRTDRRQDVIQEFRKIGVDIPSAQVEFFTADRPQEKGDFPTLGARGSFTSHREVLRLAMRDGLSNVLVFEDDVFFKPVSGATIEGILEALDRTSWDVIYFGYARPNDGSLKGPLAPWPDKTIGGHFYGVNGPFIRRMADYMQACEERPAEHPKGGPTFRDGAYYNVRLVYPDIRVFLAVPNLAEQRSSRTDLHPLKIYDRLRWMRPIMRGVRKIKNQLRSVAERGR